MCNLKHAATLLLFLTITSISPASFSSSKNPFEKQEQDFYRDYLAPELLNIDSLLEQQKRELLPQTNDQQKQQIVTPQSEEFNLLKILEESEKEPEESTCLGLYLNLLIQKHPFKLEPNALLLDKQTIQRLSLLKSSDTDTAHSVLGTIPTKTLFGKVATAEKLVTPQTSLAELNKRRSLITYLVEHQETLVKLRKALEKIASGQSSYLLFFKVQHQMAKQLLDMFYFPDAALTKNLNKSTTALTLYYTASQIQSFLSLIPLHAYGCVAYEGKKCSKILKSPNGLLTKLGAIALFPIKTIIDSTFIEILKHLPLTYAYNKTKLDDGLAHITTNKDRKFISLGDTALLDQLNNINDLRELWINKKRPYIDRIIPQPTKGKVFGSYAVAGGNLAIEDIIRAAGIYSFYFTQKIYAAVIKNFRLKLAGVARIIQGCEELDHIISKSDCPELQELITPIKKLIAQQYTDSDLGRLLRSLKSPAFSENPSIFANVPGNALATNTLMEKEKYNFVDLLYAVGQIDRETASAHLVSSTQYESNRYCIPAFATERFPLIKLTDFWNILIDSTKAVSNSIHLGTGGDQNILLTGGNGCGKTKLMKAVAQNIIEAQTLCISPAAHAIIAPVNRILVYLEEREHGEMSTFVAEKHKLDLMNDTITNLPADELSFAILDETIKGTVHQSSEELEHDALKNIIQSKQSAIIAATHAFEPTKLETETGLISNFHVEVLDDGSEFIRTFKVVRGDHPWWFKDENKRRRFINWLTAKTPQGDTAIVA